MHSLAHGFTRLCNAFIIAWINELTVAHEGVGRGGSSGRGLARVHAFTSCWIHELMDSEALGFTRLCNAFIIAWINEKGIAAVVGNW